MTSHLNLDSLVLKKGSHDPDGEFCVMEAVAYLAREPWSDRPQCACPVIASFLRSWNDGMNNEDRQSLKRYIPRLLGSKSAPEVELKRSWMAFDWLVRVQTPAWLRLAGLTEHAERLESAEPLVDRPSLDAIREGTYAAQKAASAARDAAWAAARAAAGAAAGGAARAAAWGAARAAAGAAARAAAADAKLRPTVEALQVSAHELVDRLLQVK